MCALGPRAAVAVCIVPWSGPVPALKVPAAPRWHEGPTGRFGYVSSISGHGNGNGNGNDTDHDNGHGNGNDHY